MILLPAIIEGINTRKDNTLLVKLATNELNPHKVGEIMSHHNKLCYVAIKPEHFTSDELKLIEGLKVDESIGKSPSQRLRAVMFRNFEQSDEGFKNFESYYVNKMDTIIEHLKSKLV
jgi:hypothetical protein